MSESRPDANKGPGYVIVGQGSCSYVSENGFVPPRQRTGTPHTAPTGTMKDWIAWLSAWPANCRVASEIYQAG
jgi:hypothetical protein